MLWGEAVHLLEFDNRWRCSDFFVLRREKNPTRRVGPWVHLLVRSVQSLNPYTGLS
jgi:hypothetical protein